MSRSLILILALVPSNIWACSYAIVGTWNLDVRYFLETNADTSAVLEQMWKDQFKEHGLPRIHFGPRRFAFESYGEIEPSGNYQISPRCVATLNAKGENGIANTFIMVGPNRICSEQFSCYVRQPPNE